MAENGNLQDHSNNSRIITTHAIYGFLITILSSQIPYKYHNSSPFDTHYGLMFLFVAALILYCAASVFEVELYCAQDESIYLRVATYTRLLGCAVSLVVCLFILELVVLGWIIFTIWAALFARGAYDLRSWLHEGLLVVGGFIVGKWNNLVETLFGPCKITKDPGLFIPTFA